MELKPRLDCFVAAAPRNDGFKSALRQLTAAAQAGPSASLLATADEVIE